MSPALRARSSPVSRHLGEALSPYADRSMSAAMLLACDRHVSICPGCRAAADAERRLLASLRSAATPGLSMRLESVLLGLAEHPMAPATAPAPASEHPPLAVIGPFAPARYRSPVRAALLAGFVAGVSAAAAWSVGVNALAPPTGSVPAVAAPAPQAGAAPQAIAGTWSSQAAPFLSSSHVLPLAGPWPGARVTGPRSAQSTHE